MEHLKTLSLKAARATKRDLRAFLRHASTLCSAELSNIDFRKAKNADEYGRGSFARFLQFLHEEMSLKQVRFDGALSNGWDGAWRTCDAGQGMW